MSMQNVPQDLMKLCQSMSEAQEGDEQAASQLMVLFARMCNLLASTKDITTLDTLKTIADATMLDKELKAWAIQPTNGLLISTQTAVSISCSYSDSCEIFSSIWAAEVWIIHRTARYGVNSLLLSLYSVLLAHSPPRESLAPPLEGSQEESGGNRTAYKRMQYCTRISEDIDVLHRTVSSATASRLSTTFARLATQSADTDNEPASILHADARHRTEDADVGGRPACRAAI